MVDNKRKGYSGSEAEHQQVSATSINPVTEEALASEGRGVQEDALKSGGPMGVEDGTGVAKAKIKSRQF